MSSVNNSPPTKPLSANPPPSKTAEPKATAPAQKSPSTPETQITERRQTAGVKGATDFQKATADGNSAKATIKFGEPTDVTRPKLNTQAYLKSFDPKNTGTLNQEAFQKAFGLDPKNLDVPKLMRAVDQVDQKTNSTKDTPLVSIEDAMPLVGLFDNGGTGGNKGKLDAQITPEERANATDFLKTLMDADPTKVTKRLTNLNFWYKNE